MGALFLAMSLGNLRVTSHGLALAAASGSLASGLGYTIWYSVLPSLAAWRAAVLQLIVPVLTALAAVAILHEPITIRIILSTVLVAGGVLLTIMPGDGTSNSERRT